MKLKSREVNWMQKKVQEKTSRSKNIKGRFELAPSRQPLRHKAFWEMEDDLLSKIINSPITRGLYSSFHIIYSGLYSCDYNWLNYSSLLYYIHEFRSIKAYAGINKFDYYEDAYKQQISNLHTDFKYYYEKYLGKSLTKISNQNKKQLYNTCVWMVFHLNRVKSFNQLALKVSYSVNFYTDHQESIPKDYRIGGKFAQTLIDFLVYKGSAYMYKGYKLKDTYKKSFTGGYYSGDTKSCMTMLVLDFDALSPYIRKDLNVKGKLPFYNMKGKSGLVEPYEIRVKSGSKETIDIEDFEEGWMSKVTRTEKVIGLLNQMLTDSKVSFGKYEIPEIFFRRIWIVDVDTYGRIHDSGEFQTKSKKTKKELIIDGERTATIDLCSIHPRILYTREGIQLPEDFDPYPVLEINLDEKRLKKYKKFYNLTDYNPIRNLTKVALLILINSSSETEARNALKSKLKSEKSKLMTRRESEMKYVGVPEDVDIDYVFDRIKLHNKGIAKYFTSNISMDLMNKDSDIILDAIDTLTQMGIVCLPLHDSITVAMSHKEDAKKALEYGYKNVLGTCMNFKCEEE